MITQELLNYIKNELEKGVSQEQVKNSLIATGWVEKDITDAFANLSVQKTDKNIPLDPSQSGTSQNSITQTQTTSPETKDKKEIITIVLLLLFYPIGVIMMWIWMKWKIWVKVLITIPLILSIVVLVFSFSAIVALLSNAEFTTYIPNDNSTLNEDSCFLDNDCQSGICVHTDNGRVCTEGEIGDPCFMDSDCDSDHCPNDICTAGESGDECFTSFDCEDNLSCDSGICQ